MPTFKREVDRAQQTEHARKPGMNDKLGTWGWLWMVYLHQNRKRNAWNWRQPQEWHACITECFLWGSSPCRTFSDYLCIKEGDVIRSLIRVGGLNDCMFPQDDVLTVIRRVDENWAEGMLADKIGIFPISYVEVSCAINKDVPTVYFVFYKWTTLLIMN